MGLQMFLFLLIGLTVQTAMARQTSLQKVEIIYEKNAALRLCWNTLPNCREKIVLKNKEYLVEPMKTARQDLMDLVSAYEYYQNQSNLTEKGAVVGFLVHENGQEIFKILSMDIKTPPNKKLIPVVNPPSM